MSWAAYAFLSAGFAGATAILAKMGVQGVSSNLATAVRTAIVLVFATAIVCARGEASQLPTLSRQNWLFLGLSGLATAASWLCYFRALQLGPVSRVAPIDKLSFVIAMVLGVLIFKEKSSASTVCGALLIVGGVLLTLR